jgi:hypothetical protein
MPPMMNGIRTVVRLFWVGAYHCLPHPGIDFESQTDIQSDCLQSTKQPYPPAFVVWQTDLCHRFPYLGISGCARAMVVRGWASDLSLQTKSFSMHTSHPLIRNSGITLFAVASLILSACSGMTQQEKSTAIDAGAGAIGDGV